MEELFQTSWTEKPFEGGRWEEGNSKGIVEKRYTKPGCGEKFEEVGVDICNNFMVPGV